jgi:hypothetical protein
VANLFVEEAVSIRGGKGGQGGSGNPGYGGVGGAGSAATLTVTDTLKAVSVTVASGEAGVLGEAAGGAGGAVKLTAETLIAPTINLTTQDGALTVAVETLGVREDTTLTLNKTLASDVKFTTIDLAAGNILTVVRQDSGNYTFDALNAHGTGAIYKDSTALNLTNKTLTFFLPAEFSSSKAMLTVKDSSDQAVTVNIAQVVAVGLDFEEGYAPQSKLGDTQLLMSNITGTLTSSLKGPEYVIKKGTADQVTYRYAMISTPVSGSLIIYHKEVEAQGDWETPVADYAVDSTNGDVSLKVGGTLSGVEALTLTRNNNGLFVSVETLDGTKNSVTLNLSDTALGDGTGSDGVFFKNIDIAANQALTVNRTNGDYGFDALTVKGLNATYSDSALDLSGKALAFHLTSVTSPGTMLSVGNAAVNIANAIVTLVDGALSPSKLPELGNALVLIGNTTGKASIPLPALADYKDGNVTYRYAWSPRTDTLALYHSGVDATDDWTAPAGYTMMSSTYGPVSLKVGGTLSVTDPLTLTKDKGYALTVDVKKLDVTQNNVALTLNGTTAGNGSGADGVFFDTIDIAGEKTLTVDGSGAYAFNTLNVLGKDAAYEGRLDAEGKNLNFRLSPDFREDGTILLTVKERKGVTDSGKADITGSVVNIDIATNSVSPEKGDSVILIHAEQGIEGKSGNETVDPQLPQPQAVPMQARVTQGVSLAGVALLSAAPDQGDGLFHLDTDKNNLYAMFGELRLNPQLKAVSEGFLSGLALINQGGDLVAGQGMKSAQAAATAALRSTETGLAAFGAVLGGRSRYETGSHVKMDGQSLITGLSAGADLAPGQVTLGAFLEYGNGTYDTYNAFSDLPSVHGDGKTRHTCGGVLGRLDLEGAGPGSLYLEASARGGRLRNDYDNPDLRDSQGRGTGFRTTVPYYSLHAGAGYVWPLASEGSLELYGKYFWTREEGDSVRLRTGDPVRFEAADSHRLRAGVKYVFKLSERLDARVGLAGEHEFDGKVRATAYGYEITRPDLKGNTVIGEVGLSMKPSPSLPLTIDLGVQGYTGKRDGVTGSFRLNYRF